MSNFDKLMGITHDHKGLFLACCVIFLLMTRETKILTCVLLTLVFLAVGAIQPTGLELAGLGALLAGFAVLYWAVNERSRSGGTDTCE